jgi:hypothetical protein
MGSSRDRDIKYLNATIQPDGSYKTNGGNILYFDEDGRRHNSEGPSVICKNNFPLYSLDSEYIEGEGLTTQSTSPNVLRVKYYLHDAEYDFIHWLKLVSISDECKMMLRLQYG